MNAPFAREPSQQGFIDTCVQLAVGGGAAAISRTTMAPLSRVKTLLQVWPQPRQGLRPVAMSVAESTARALAAPLPMTSLGIKSRGWRAVARAMYRADGLMGFWRGNGTNCLRILPTAALNHALFPWWKRRLANAVGVQHDRASSLGLFLLRTGAGTLSVGCTLALLYPLEVARTRLTCDVAMTNGRRTYGGVLDCLVATARSEGVPALYKGFLVSASAVLPMLVVSHATFDALRQTMLSGRDDWAWQAIARVSVGATAALAAQLAVYPLDTVRRRLQLDGSAALHDGPFATVGHRVTTPDHGLGTLGSVEAAAEKGAAAVAAATSKASRGVAATASGAGIAASTAATRAAATIASSVPGVVQAAAAKAAPALDLGSLRKRLPDPAGIVNPLRARLRLPPWFSGWAGTTLHRPKYGGSAITCFRRMVAEEGWISLYRGIIPQAVKTFPAALVQYFVYTTLWYAVTQPVLP